MSKALALAPAATPEMVSQLETRRLTTVSSLPTIRRAGFWTALRRTSRRVGRWLTTAARWLSSPKGKACLAVAGEGLALAGVVSRATMSDTLDAVGLAIAPFAPSRREGPKVVWG